MFWIFTKIAIAALGYVAGTLGIQQKGLNNLTVGLFSTAFICDIWATYDMYTLHTNLSEDFIAAHSIPGILAIIFAASLEFEVIRGILIPKYAAHAQTVFQKHGYYFLIIWFVAVLSGTILGIRHAAMTKISALYAFP